MNIYIYIYEYIYIHKERERERAKYMGHMGSVFPKRMNNERY